MMPKWVPGYKPWNKGSSDQWNEPKEERAGYIRCVLVLRFTQSLLELRCFKEYWKVDYNVLSLPFLICSALAFTMHTTHTMHLLSRISVLRNPPNNTVLLTLIRGSHLPMSDITAFHCCILPRVLSIHTVGWITSSSASPVLEILVLMIQDQTF